MDENEARRLSKMLFVARESIEMFADIVENRTSRRSKDLRRQVAEIDQYRAEHRWSPNGFGNEPAE